MKLLIITIQISVLFFFSSCKLLYERETVILDSNYKRNFSTSNFMEYTPVLGDSILFEVTPASLKEFLSKNKVVWLHFAYTRMCADAELYDCKTYKALNAKYRNKMKYISVSEVAHLDLAQQLNQGCSLLGHTTFIDEQRKVHNETKAIRNFKKELFQFPAKDTLNYQTNYIIIDGKVVYASSHVLDVKKFEAILDQI
jgi:hypothetical protein